jgi:phosphohistidine phosphatase
MHFDLVLASTAARVRETIDGLQEHFTFEAPIRFEPELYLASSEKLLQIIRALPETVRAPLLLGHNPGLQRLIVELTKDDDEGRRRRVAQNYPTAALAVIELPAARWSDLAPGGGEIAELIFPKELD